MAYTNIDDPSAHFQAETYTGAGANTSVTFSGNSDLKPDFLWIKNRTAGYAHAAFDSNRNLGSAVNAPFLEPNDTSTENSNQNWWNATNNGINTDGFQFGSVSEHNLNNLGSEYVAWAWKANGGTTSTDTTSSITSTVQVNSDAGFSIVTYTGNGNTLGGFGHGLGVAPKVVFVKRRNAAANWCVYHKDMGAAYFMKLDSSDAKATGPWQDLDPSSNTVIVYSGGLVNGNGDTYVAYCFAEKQGYSKFGSYVGNGNANGPFVYTGFKPAFVLIKRTDSADNWFLYDTKRSPFNEADEYIRANIANAEGSNNFQIDMLSNGFKTRNSGAFIGALNASGGSYIYMAFAENSFVTSTGIPTTAR